MNYLNERKAKWKKSISQKGVNHDDFEKIYPHIKMRGYFRYCQLIKELRKVKDQAKDTSNISINQINAIYIFDIHFRRELMRILTPLEVQLKSSLQLEHDRNSKEYAHVVINKKVQTFLNTKFYRELNPDKQVKYMKRVSSVLKSVEKRREKISFRSYVDILMIGELINLILISHQGVNMVRRVLSKSTWDGSPEPLIFLENLRNGAFHHNLFGRVSKNKSNKVCEIMPNFISVINTFFGENNQAVESIKRRTKEEIDSKEDLVNEIETIKLLYGSFWEN